MGVEEFGGEIREGVIVQRELALQGAIRDALALPEERDNLIQSGIKSSTCINLLYLST
jgi:hypothetical protein